VKLAKGDPRAIKPYEAARRLHGNIVIAASTLTEVLRGGPRDAPVCRVLGGMSIVPVDEQHARSAGELLGRTGLSGHRCALDAMLATVALAQPRPVVLLTSDPDDLGRLTEEPGRPRRERVLIVRI
jgi:predicted nucleic acid-binding protein